MNSLEEGFTLSLLRSRYQDGIKCARIPLGNIHMCVRKMEICSDEKMQKGKIKREHPLTVMLAVLHEEERDGRLEGYIIGGHIA